VTIQAQILPHRSGTGAANMALDEALLDEVAAHKAFAYIRTYEWSIPTLSLGYFQSLNEALTESRFRSVPIVRRPTGGGALWHDREITYAVVIPADHPLARQTKTFYRAVHEALANVIRPHGLPIDRRGDVSNRLVEIGHQETRTGSRPFLCFTDRDPEDLVSGRFKLVGSAQRRRAGAVLQHGSVLLGRSDVTPELPGLTDLIAEKALDLHYLRMDAIATAIARSLQLTTQFSELPDRVRLRATELESSIYSNPEWTGRR